MAAAGRLSGVRLVSQEGWKAVWSRDGLSACLVKYEPTIRILKYKNVFIY